MSGVRLNKADLAKHYGKSLPTISQWVAKGCPFVSKGGPGKEWVFDSAEVASWREEQIAQQAVGDVESLDIEEARRRKMAAEAALAELDLFTRRGDLIEVDLVAGLIGEEYANVRAKILAIPTKLAPQLQGVTSAVERQDLIERAIIEVLEELTADGIYSGAVSEESDQVTEDVESKAAA
jgi:phage terminase Nu1 subunit (DNA packaging protein)